MARASARGCLSVSVDFHLLLSNIIMRARHYWKFGYLIAYIQLRLLLCFPGCSVFLPDRYVFASLLDRLRAQVPA